MSVGLSVATAAEGFRTITEILPAIAFHAVFAMAGLQLVSFAKRKERTRAAVDAA